MIQVTGVKDYENDLLLWPSRDPQKSKRLRREAGEWLEEAENELKQEVGRTSLQSTLIFQALAAYCGDVSHGTGYVFRGYPLGQSFLDSKGSEALIR